MRTDTDGAACAQASPPARPTNIISRPPCMVVSFLPIRALHYKTRAPPKSAPWRKFIFGGRPAPAQRARKTVCSTNQTNPSPRRAGRPPGCG